MQLEQLQLEAFGPFAGRQQVDFKALSGSGIFVITGPTGAGKTSIFDGVMFALYGRASGDSRPADGLRSDYAAEDAVSRVRLVFTVRGQRYTVERAPKQVRCNSRGNYSTFNQQAALYLPDGQVLTRVREVDEQLAQLVGLGAEQFRQIVLLPQGEFQRLLQSSSADKQLIFRRIFGTQLFARLEEALKAELAAQQEALQAHQAQRQLLLHQLNGSGDGALQQLLDTDYPDVEAICQLLEQRQQAGRSALDELAAQLEKNRRDQQKYPLEQMSRDNAAIVQLQSCQQALAALDEQAGEQAQRRCQLAQMEKLVRCRQAAQQAQEHRARRDEAAAGLKEAQTQWDDLQQRRSEIESAERELRELESRRGESDRRLQLEKSRLESLHLRQKLEGSLQDSLLTLQRLDTVEQYVQCCAEQADLAALRAQAVALQEQLAEFGRAGCACRAAQEEYDRISGAYHRSQAGQLAQTLRPDAPCPVCGSTHHPAPAKTVDAGADYPALQAATAALTAATAALRQRDAQLAAALEQLNGSDLLPVLGTLSALKADPALAAGATLFCDERQQQLRQKQSRLAEALAAFCPVDQLQKKGLDTAAGVAASRAGVQGKRQLWAEQLTALPTGCAQEVQDKVRRLEEERQASEKRQEALRRQLAEYEQQLASCRERLAIRRQLAEQTAQAVRESAEALAALLAREEVQPEQLRRTPPTTAQRQQLQEQIDRYEQERQRLLGQKEALAAYEGRALSDLEEARRVLDALREQEQSARQQVTALQLTLQKQKSSLSQLQQLLKEQGRLDEAYMQVQDLYRVASGKNSQHLSFERYVLSGYFDRVLAAANLRLDQMTQGKYMLLRRTEKEKGNAPSGLEMEVLDSYSGKARPVSTLSGGESFKAALSLALGLADVIGAQSGGIALDTVFIDEGFGSLDPQSLEEAMNTLEALKKEERLVGIISHVQALKERFPQGIEVRPLPGGGSAIYQK